MKIGFIGAGKMGFTMGRHLADYFKSCNNVDNAACKVAGYYSRTADSARQAAEFTDTKYYEDLSDLARECEILFITTPDGQINEVAEKLSHIISDNRDKILIHTSGAMSSQVFSGMGSHVFGYSIHPMYAVSSKTDSYINFNKAFITIEGNEKYLDFLASVFENMGHRVKVISEENKVKYHGAAVFASNLVIGLYFSATKLLEECGFGEEEAFFSLLPLFVNNAENVAKNGLSQAITGPVARNDFETVEKHLSALKGEDREIYRLLSKKLVSMIDACGYDEMNSILAEASRLKL